MGHANVDAMLASMSSQQVSEWQAFWQVEPWGEYREDWRMANLLAQLVNMLRGKDQEAMGPGQFMPQLDPTGATEPPLSVGEQATNAFEANWRAAVGEE